jgi:glycosyltransferase involved in cell wall biosynthesis
VIDLIFPHFYYRYTISRWLDLIRAKAINQASAIIADSENTKKDIVRLLKIDESKIKVIHLGVDESFRPIDEEHLINDVKERYGIDCQYVLHVGGVSPTKNVDRLLLAFKSLLNIYREDIALVITGDFNFTPAYKKHFEKVLSDLELVNHVVLPGNVSNDDLVLLYNGACVFAFPSLYEGFGLPALEAMACGTAVIASNTSSIQEVVGGAGLYVDPCKIDEIAVAMRKVIMDSQLREKMVARGIERAKLFSWKKMAKDTLTLYHDLYNGNISTVYSKKA